MDVLIMSEYGSNVKPKINMHVVTETVTKWIDSIMAEKCVGCDIHMFDIFHTTNTT